MNKQSSSHPIQNIGGFRGGCGCGVWGIIILASLAILIFLLVDGILKNATPPSAIETGSTVSGDSSFLGVSRWTFTGQSGDGINISLVGTDDDYDPLVRLFGPNGHELISDDDSGESLNALINCYALPVSGIYTIQADGFGGDTGSYELSLQTVELKLTRNIEYGQQVEDSLNQCQQSFAFNGDAGDIVWVTLSDSSFDAMLQLLDPNGVEIAANDDSFGSDPALQGIALPSSGTYRIILRPYREGRTGNYVLELSEGE